MRAWKQRSPRRVPPQERPCPSGSAPTSSRHQPAGRSRRPIGADACAATSCGAGARALPRLGPPKPFCRTREPFPRRVELHYGENSRIDRQRRSRRPRRPTPDGIVATDNSEPTRTSGPLLSPRSEKRPEAQRFVDSASVPTPRSTRWPGRRRSRPPRSPQLIPGAARDSTRSNTRKPALCSFQKDEVAPARGWAYGGTHPTADTCCRQSEARGDRRGPRG